MNADDDRSQREGQLDAAMEEDVYRRAGQETGYWADDFLRDLRANGGARNRQEAPPRQGNF